MHQLILLSKILLYQLSLKIICWGLHLLHTQFIFLCLSWWFPVFLRRSTISHFFLHHPWRFQCSCGYRLYWTKNISQSSRYFQPSSNREKKSTRLHGHILCLILSPSDSSLISNVTVGNLVLDHTLVKKCDPDITCPAIPKIYSISYHRYHNIIFQSFCEDLANACFVPLPASMAAGLYDQYICNLGGVLDRHVLLICWRAKKIPARWLPDSYSSAKSIRHQFEC